MHTKLHKRKSSQRDEGVKGGQNGKRECFRGRSGNYFVSWCGAPEKNQICRQITEKVNWIGYENDIHTVSR